MQRLQITQFTFELAISRMETNGLLIQYAEGTKNGLHRKFLRSASDERRCHLKGSTWDFIGKPVFHDSLTKYNDIDTLLVQKIKRKWDEERE